MSAPTFDDLAGGKTPEDVVRDAARAAQLLAFMCEMDPARLRSVPGHELHAAHLSLKASAAHLLSTVTALGAIDAIKTGGAA